MRVCLFALGIFAAWLDFGVWGCWLITIGPLGNDHPLLTIPCFVGAIILGMMSLTGVIAALVVRDSDLGITPPSSVDAIPSPPRARS